MLNILPYWQQVEGLEGAYGLFRNNSGRVLNTTTLYGKDVWLGETGWPSSDENVTTRNTNNLASPENAKQYFDKIGCQVLLGSGSGFYYVDWDQDAARAGQAQFELLDTEGNALNKIDTTCAGFVAEQNLESWVPKFAGGPAGL